MSKAKKNILFAALAALALTVCLVGVTGAYFIAQAYDETEDFWYYAKTLQPGEDCRNDALFDTVTYSESADATALNHYTLSVYFEAVQEGGTW